MVEKLLIVITKEEMSLSKLFAQISMSDVKHNGLSYLALEGDGSKSRRWRRRNALHPFVPSTESAHSCPTSPMSAVHGANHFVTNGNLVHLKQDGPVIFSKPAEQDFDESSDPWTFSG